MIKAKRSDGLGLAGELGFPTINLYHASEDCGVFIVDEQDYGLGVAFIMPNLTEIHFFDEVKEQKNELVYEILYKIDPPENGILDYFYKGLACDKDSSSGA